MEQFFYAQIPVRRFCVALLCLSSFKVSAQKKDVLHYVNPFTGTARSSVFTRWGNEGGTYPGAVAPWSYFQLSPETRANGNGYDYGDSTISYFSCMQHHSGYPGGSSGRVHIMPVTALQNITQGRRFLHEDEHAAPGYYSVLFRDNGTRVEATAALHGGLFRFTFPVHVEPALFISDAGELSMRSPETLEGQIIKTFSRSHEIITDTENITIMRFSKPVTDTQRVAGGFFIKFSPEAENSTVITAELSASSAGFKNAMENIDAELSGYGFDQVLARTQNEWNKQLSVITIWDTSEENKAIFYTALYHSLLLPWIISDVSGNYRGRDRKLHRTGGRDEYGGFSPWDTFRSLHPLLTLLYPERQADMLSSIMDIYRQTGYLPTESMTGNHSIPILVDSYLKGIKINDSALLYEAMQKSIVTGPFLQKDMNLYRQGFIPYPNSESVTRTVEYSYDDWALAQFADKVMHDRKLYGYLMQRSRNYRNLFNTEELGLLPRKGDVFYHATGNAGYKEGDQWVYTYALPQYQRDLINLLGGDKNFTQELDEAFKDNRLVFDNETMLHVPYLFNSTPYPYKTQEWVHNIMQNRFAPTPGGLPGNDDLGAISSWYVWSALGLFPVCPGNPVYAIGTPLFREADILLPGGKKWQVIAENNAQNNFYVKKVEVNGRPYRDKWLSHATLIRGGKILFDMSSSPYQTKMPGFIPGETDSLMRIRLSGFQVKERQVIPDAPLCIRFSLHNAGAPGTAVVKLHINDSLVIRKNCFVPGHATVKDSILCRLYAYGGNKLQIEGMPAIQVRVVRPEHPVNNGPQITDLEISPLAKKGMPIRYSYVVKNKGGNRQEFIIPVMLNGRLILQDTIVLHAGDSGKEIHSIAADMREGLYELQVINKSAKTKIYTAAKDAIVLDMPEELLSTDQAKDLSGFGNDGHKAEEGNYILLPHTASLDSNGTSLTMMAWIYDMGNRKSLTDLLAKGDNHVLQLSGGRNLSFFAGGWGRGECTVPLPGDWHNHWHHITGVCTGASLQVYIDGVPKGTTSLDEVIDLSVPAAWTIGSNEEFPLNRTFNGKIKGVKIFAAALSADDIKAIYQKEKSAAGN